MISDTIFISQSLINNLFYLRTLREFCLNVQLSFFNNNQNIISIANDLGKRYEELGMEAIRLANGRIPNKIISSDSFVTDYTLNLELLTEKLFSVNINTNLTIDEANLSGYDDVNELKYNDEVIDRIFNLNKNAIELTNNFIDFCNYIKDAIRNTNVFSYSYVSIYEFMIEEASLYVNDLTRLQQKTGTDPTYIINFEYYFSKSMMDISKFIIGLSDPNQTSIIMNADNYRKSFSNLMRRYQEAKLSPDTLKVLNEDAINLVESFISFIKKIINGILNQNYYFIVEPIFFDNMLTEAYYFLYLLKGADLGVK